MSPSPVMIRVAQMRRDGLAFAEIAATLGITRATARRVAFYARQAKLDTGALGARVYKTHPLARVAVEDYTQRQLADMLGVTLSAIHAALKRLGRRAKPVTCGRPTTGVRRPRHLNIPEHLRDDYALYLRKGYRAAEAKAALGIET